MPDRKLGIIDDNGLGNLICKHTWIGNGNNADCKYDFTMKTALEANHIGHTHGMCNILMALWPGKGLRM